MIKTGTMEERPQNRGSHKLSVMNRRTGSITGVSDVISFDISEVLLETGDQTLMGLGLVPGAAMFASKLCNYIQKFLVTIHKPVLTASC